VDQESSIKHCPAEPACQSNAVLFAVCSAVGIFVFFVPVSISAKTTIILDHIITVIQSSIPRIAAVYAAGVICAGAVLPFITRSWKQNTGTMIFSLLKAAGSAATLLLFTLGKPSFLFAEDMAPFLFYKLVIPVGIIVPVGAVFLAFLVDYGLLEFAGMLMEPVMRPVWKTPGRSAIDAVASFVGSYSIGLLITNKVYKEGLYSVKQASIIATGFSTVSAAFMIIVARTTELSHMWNFYFWSTLGITFAVTALTVRLYPLSRMDDTSNDMQSSRGGLSVNNRFKQAFTAGAEKAGSAQPLALNIKNNLKAAFSMTAAILPTIMSVGLLGLAIAKHTPLFTAAGYLFYPVVKILGIPQAALVGKAAAVGITEMFLPALLITGAPAAARYVVAVTSVSSILFFSASIPCILSTDIPLSPGKIVLIWFERTLISLLLAGLVALAVF